MSIQTSPDLPGTRSRRAVLRYPRGGLVNALSARYVLGPGARDRQLWRGGVHRVFALSEATDRRFGRAAPGVLCDSRASFCTSVLRAEIDAVAARPPLADLRDQHPGAVGCHARVHRPRVERPDPQVTGLPLEAAQYHGCRHDRAIAVA